MVIFGFTIRTGVGVGASDGRFGMVIFGFIIPIVGVGGTGVIVLAANEGHLYFPLLHWEQSVLHWL